MPAPFSVTELTLRVGEAPVPLGCCPPLPPHQQQLLLHPHNYHARHPITIPTLEDITSAVKDVGEEKYAKEDEAGTPEEDKKRGDLTRDMHKRKQQHQHQSTGDPSAVSGGGVKSKPKNRDVKRNNKSSSIQTKMTSEETIGGVDDSHFSRRNSAELIDDIKKSTTDNNENINNNEKELHKNPTRKTRLGVDQYDHKLPQIDESDDSQRPQVDIDNPIDLPSHLLLTPIAPLAWDKLQPDSQVSCAS